MKFGQFLTGMTFRWISIFFEDNMASYNWAKHLGFVFVRGIMISEFFFAWYIGKVDVWIYQFILCTWWNLILVFSNHEYHEDTYKNTKLYDWAEYQIMNSHDLRLTGNAWVDDFLLAGLATHKVHHLLPQQQSAFANIYCEPIIIDLCKKYNIKWEKPKSFLFEKVPELLNTFFIRNIDNHKLKKQFERKEQGAIMTILTAAYMGFEGVRSI